MPVPVVMQAGFQLEPLAGEARVERLGSRQRMRRAPGGVDHVPDAGFGGIRHAHRAVELVHVHHQQRGRHRVDRIHDRDGEVHLRA